MPKIPRKTADYFKKLPDADPMADKPAEAAAPKKSQKAVEALLPSWAAKPVDEMELDDASLPVLSNDDWAHLEDTTPEDTDGTSKESKKRSGRLSVMQTLIAERKPGHVESPTSVIENADMAMHRTTSRKLKGDYSDPISRLRQVGRSMAKNRNGADSPTFNRTIVEGAGATDFPLPGTSFAHMGVRGSFGRTEVNSARIESDQLFLNKKDVRHAGDPDVRSGPLNIDQARGMLPGERYAISAERSVLAEAGLKYTPSPLPFVSSSMLHDFGPSGMVDVTAAVEGETSIEIVRGFGSKVALTISSRDERVLPGKDKTWKASVGAFLDGSLIEYMGQAFRKFASQGMEDGLYDLEDKKNNIDLRVTPAVDKFNEHASASISRRKVESTGRVRLYELVLDLDKPEAQAVFKKLVGHSGEREIDFTALEDLGEDSGVDLVSNHVKQAARRSVEHTFAAFGLESHKAEVTETSEAHEGEPGAGRKKLQEKHGTVVRTKTPSELRESVSIGRVKTVTDEATGDTQTAVGFGWQLSVDDKHTSTGELAALLSFGAELTGEVETREKLDALRVVAEDLPRRRVLGMPIGARGVGDTSTALRLEVNADAVTRLFKKLQDPDAREGLWKDLAAGFAKQHGLETPPDWPVRTLDDDGILAKMRRKLPSLSKDRAAFLATRSALRTLESAADQTDPVEAARQLSKGFASLGGDLGVAAVLLNAARDDEGGGVETSFELKGAEELAERAARAAETPPSTSAAATAS